MFDSEYSRQVTKNEIWYHPEKCTILPFFGYHATVRSVTYTDSYGGNYTVTQEGNNSYKVTKSPTYFYQRVAREYAEYTRGRDYSRYEPELDALEEKFYQKYIVQDGVDVWYSPHIAPTLDDFHKRHGGPKNAGLLSFLGLSGILLGIASIIVFGILLMDVIEGFLPSFLPISATHVAAIPFCLFMGGGVLSLVKRHKEIKTYRATPLQQMPAEYRESLRNRYYKGMINVYGNELGSILQRYAQLMESAKKKSENPFQSESTTRKKRSSKK